LVAGAGAALGELSGYLVGFGGQVVLERKNKYPQIEGWVKRYGQWAILVLSFIPNPLFDLAGMTAGVLKMPLWKFLLFCWIGSTAKMLVFAYGGASIERLFLFYS
jgi:membrane protein DedA with SNARE-associated domain